MQILIMHQTVASHDAIGNDIEAMFRLLNQHNQCAVYAENRLNKNVTYLDRDQTVRWLSSPKNVVIYHHSVFWQHGQELLISSKARIIFRYHNITPGHFFAPYNKQYEALCISGRAQTEYLIKQFPDAVWLCDSDYNASELKGLNPDSARICAPFHKIETWAQADPDEEILHRLLFSSGINLLSVGRIAPNKGHLFMLKVLRIFQICFSKEIHLWLLGKPDEGLSGYNEQINRAIKCYELQKYVHIVGEITDAAMSAYYLGCDGYLCVSEHEGFCVPIEEAQFFKLPVLARNSTAIPETLGPNQLLLDEKPWHYAAVVNWLDHNPAKRQVLQNVGKENYLSRFSIDRIQKSFWDAMNSWNVFD